MVSNSMAASPTRPVTNSCGMTPGVSISPAWPASASEVRSPEEMRIVRLLKMASSKAARSEDPEAYLVCTLRGLSDRERRWGAFSAACQYGMSSSDSPKWWPISWTTVSCTSWMASSSVSHRRRGHPRGAGNRSEEHTSELQSLAYLVCRLLLEKKKKNN